MYLAKDKPELLRITFVDSGATKKVTDAVEKQDRDSLLLQCKWEPGNYEVTISVTDGSGKAVQYKCTMNISGDDVKLLRGNVDKILANCATTLANQDKQVKYDTICSRTDIDKDEKERLIKELGEKGKLVEIYGIKINIEVKA